MRHNLLLLAAALLAAAPACAHNMSKHSGLVKDAAALLARSVPVGETQQLAPGVFRETWRLPMRPLLAGETLVTEPQNTLLRRPLGRAAILAFDLDLLDGRSNASAPLSQLYNHHYVVLDSAGASRIVEKDGVRWPPLLSTRSVYADLLARNVSFNAGPCEMARYIFGGGAEFRGVNSVTGYNLTKYAAENASMPRAAWITGADEDSMWGMNLHVIDLRNVSNVRSCVQCSCAYYGQVPGSHNHAIIRSDPATGALPGGGGMQCCPDGAQCDAGGATEAVTYVVQYSITYANATEVVDAMAPLLRSVLTVESYNQSNGFTCGVEYNPRTCRLTEPAGTRLDGATCDGFNASNQEFIWVTPASVDIDLFLAVGHAHVGALGVTLYIAAPGAPEELLCVSKPEYSSSGPDRGFVINMSACDWSEAPRRINGGTRLRVVASYAAGPLPQAAFQMPWQGVMGYMNMNYVLASPPQSFGVITHTGAQNAQGSVIAAPAPSSFPPKCLVRLVADPSAAANESLTGNALTAVNITDAAPSASAPKSIVLTTSPALYTMSWSIDKARGTVSITLSLNTTGYWFGIGVHNPGTEGGMIDADMVLVSHSDADQGSGERAVLDVAEYWSQAYAMPTRKEGMGGDGNGLSLCSAMASLNGGQRVSFTRPLQGKGSASQNVVPGASASLAWAIGATQHPTQKHQAAGRLLVEW